MAAGAMVRAATASPTCPARSAASSPHRHPIGDAARIVSPPAIPNRSSTRTPSPRRDSDNYDLATLWRRQVRGARASFSAPATRGRPLGEPLDLLHGLLERPFVVLRRGTTQVFAEAGYGITTPYADLEPFAGVAYVSLHTDAMSETGGAAALQSGSSTQDNTFTTLGLRAAKGFAVNGGTLTASASLGWQYAFGDTTPVSTLSFEAGGSAFQRRAPPSPATRPSSASASTSPRRRTSPSACIMRPTRRLVARQRHRRTGVDQVLRRKASRADWQRPRAAVIVRSGSVRASWRRRVGTVRALAGHKNTADLRACHGPQPTVAPRGTRPFGRHAL